MLHRVTAAALLPGALLATAALLFGCTSGPGPLGAAGDKACAGFNAAPGQIMTFGMYWLQNAGNSTVTIQSVTLGASHGLKISGGAWILPIVKNTGIGVASWPPGRLSPGMARIWAMRRPAVGAEIKPGHRAELVLGVSRTTTGSARSGGPVIVYAAGGSTYTVQKNPAISLGPTC